MSGLINTLGSKSGVISETSWDNSKRLDIDQYGSIEIEGNHCQFLKNNDRGNGSKSFEGEYALQGNYTGDGLIWWQAAAGLSYHIEAGMASYQGNARIDVSFYFYGNSLHNATYHLQAGTGTYSTPTVTGAATNKININFPYSAIDHPLMWWRVQCGGNTNLTGDGIYPIID